MSIPIVRSAPTEPSNGSAPTEPSNWTAPTEPLNWSAPTELLDEFDLDEKFYRGEIKEIIIRNGQKKKSSC